MHDFLNELLYTSSVNDVLKIWLNLEPSGVHC